MLTTSLDVAYVRLLSPNGEFIHYCCGSNISFSFSFHSKIGSLFLFYSTFTCRVVVLIIDVRIRKNSTLPYPIVIFVCNYYTIQISFSLGQDGFSSIEIMTLLCVDGRFIDVEDLEGRETPEVFAFSDALK